MPNIPTYNVGPQALRPTETGVDSFAQAGRRIGGIYNDVASAERQTGNQFAEALGQGIKAAGDAYVSYEDHRQISAGMPAASELLLNLQTQANNITKNADPNNPAVYGKFREDVLEPALEKFQESFTTENSQRWAMEQANGIREHMQHKMIADMSTLAANAVSLNLEQTANTASNAVRQDPSALDFTLKMLAHSTGATVDSSPNITPDDAARVKGEVLQKLSEKVVKSAVWGAIEANPDEGVKLASDPRYSKYISGEEVTQAQAYAKMQRRAALSDQERTQALQDKMQRDQSRAQANDILTKLGSDDPQTVAQVSAKGILKDPNLVPEDKLSLFRFVQAENKPETESAASAKAYNPLLDRIYAPWGTPDKISDIRQLLPYKSQLTRADFNDLAKKLDDSQQEGGSKLTAMKQQFFSTYKSTITSAAGMKIENDDGLYRFRRYIDDKVDSYVRENKDPASLFNPGSSDFLGTPGQMSAFKMSMTQALTKQAQGLSGKTSENTPPLPPGAPKGAQMLPDKQGRYHPYVYSQVPNVRTGKMEGKWQIWGPARIFGEQ